jgi:CRISPR-associated protein Csb2
LLCRTAANVTQRASVVPCLRGDLADLERSTDDPEIAEATVPRGAVWCFAERPEREPLREIPKRPTRRLPETCFLQFAIGSRVSPTIDSAAILTNRFRGRAINILSGGSWSTATAERKEAIALFAGKGADKMPLEGHRHAFFALWFDPATRKASRLLVWRRTPFSHEEQKALVKAAEAPMSLGYNEKGKDPWSVYLVPLDSIVAAPPGFDLTQRFSVWKTMTPFVPPQHIYDRHGNEKRGKSLKAQILGELQNHGYPTGVTIEVLRSQWVKVHQSRSDHRENTNTEKRGHLLRLTFLEPIAGPIALGHSCHFGLGLLIPEQ